MRPECSNLLLGVMRFPKPEGGYEVGYFKLSYLAFAHKTHGENQDHVNNDGSYEYCCHIFTSESLCDFIICAKGQNNTKNEFFSKNRLTICKKSGRIVELSKRRQEPHKRIDTERAWKNF